MSLAKELIEICEVRSNSISFDIFEAILGQSVQNVMDGLSGLSKNLRKEGSPDSADALTAMKKEFQNILKKADQDIAKNLLDKITPFKFKEFEVPFIGKAKVINVNTSGAGYFVELQAAPGLKFNISHRTNGAWDSSLEVSDKSHKLYPGGYGPQGKHKFPDLAGIMKTLAKGVR